MLVLGGALTPHTRAAQQLDPVISQYRDRRFDGTQERFEHCLKTSTTLYVGNLSFYTTEEQIYEASAATPLRTVSCDCLGRARPVTYRRGTANRCSLAPETSGA